MDPDAPFEGHLLRIAEHARRCIPRVVGIRPRIEADGRRIVQILIDPGAVRPWLRSDAMLREFCRSEGIAPDYTFTFNLPFPKSRCQPPGVSPDDLPDAW